MNRSANHNHWIILKLIGTKSNRDGLGTKIGITTAQGVQYNHATTAVGYNSSSDKRVHFGLGESTRADLEVHWTNGLVERFPGIERNQLVTIKEGQGLVKSPLQGIRSPSKQGGSNTKK